MKASSKNSISNNTYPLLTVGNINYWYWEVEPHWSGNDIARHIGCSSNTVYGFMRRNKIPIRNMSDAIIVRFACPQKYEAFIDMCRTEQFRDIMSEQGVKAWDNPQARRKTIKAMKEGWDFHLSDLQQFLLSLLFHKQSQFLTDLMSLTELSINALDQCLRMLYRRKLVDRQKKINESIKSGNKLHFNYTITQKGIELLPDCCKSSQFSYKDWLEQIKSINPSGHKSKSRKSTYINIGKNQKLILETLERLGPLFLVDLRPLLPISSSSIDSSLRLLSSRGFILREKEVNPEYSNTTHPRQFKYSIIPKGKELISKE